MADVEAGWYPDPRERHELRYWDGQAWTDHVADQGVAALDPVSPPPLWMRRPEPAEPPPVVAPRPVVEPQREPAPEADEDAAAPGLEFSATAVALTAGGTALLLSLPLPWYAVRVVAPGVGIVRGEVSGFRALSVLDLLCLAVGVAAVALGFALLVRVRLPAWAPGTVAVAALAAMAGAVYRLAESPLGVGDTNLLGFGSFGLQVTRGPGPFLALVSALVVCVAAAGAGYRPSP